MSATRITRRLLNVFSAKGDLLGYDGANNARLGVGTNRQALFADSTQTAGLAWNTVPIPLAADPGAPADGEEWYNTTARAFRTREAGMTVGRVGLAYVMAADSASVSNTTALTLIQSGPTFPANFFTAGKSLRLKYTGIYLGAAAAGTFNFELYTNFGLGNQVAIESGQQFTANNSSPGSRYGCEYLITCRSVGAAGSVMVGGHQLGEFNGTNAFQVLGGNLITLDTTSTLRFDAVVKWGTAATGNTTHLQTFTVEVLDNPS